MDGVEGWVHIAWNDYSILLINYSYINGSTLNWIPCSDWLSKWVSWAHLTCLGVPALIPCKKKKLWSWLTKCLLSFGKCHQWNCQKKNTWANIQPSWSHACRLVRQVFHKWQALKLIWGRNSSGIQNLAGEFPDLQWLLNTLESIQNNSLNFNLSCFSISAVGHENYGAVYSTADENYDNSSVYQSLDKNTPAAPPVYQSLKNNQPSTKKPIPKQKQSNAKNPGKPSVPPDPVYSVLEESHIKQGNTSEAIYNVLEGPDPGHDTSGNIQDPVYNVLDGPDAGQTYEAPDVGVQQDPLYNVLEVPESKQEHQEPLYNVLESAGTENAPSRQHGPSDGATSEPLYNVLDGADSSGAEYAAPNRPLSADSHDNPAYEQTLEFGAPHALVDSPGAQRESLYEPLKGSDRQDVYEPLHKKGKWMIPRLWTLSWKQS